MCLTSRYDAAFFLLVVGLALLFAVPWKRGGWIGLTALAGVALLGVGTFMASSQVSKVAYFLRVFEASDPAKSADKQPFFEKLLVGLETAPKYLGGFWGHTWTPGWHDVPLGARAPYVLTIMAAGAFVAVGLRRGGWRKWTALAIIAGSMVLLPALFYANGAMDTIELYQARYIFPLLAPTFFLMLAVDQDEGGVVHSSAGRLGHRLHIAVPDNHPAYAAAAIRAGCSGTVGTRPQQAYRVVVECTGLTHDGLVPHDLLRHCGTGNRHRNADAHS